MKLLTVYFRIPTTTLQHGTHSIPWRVLEGRIVSSSKKRKGTTFNDRIIL